MYSSVDTSTGRLHPRTILRVPLGATRRPSVGSLACIVLVKVLLWTTVALVLLSASNRAGNWPVI